MQGLTEMFHETMRATEEGSFEADGSLVRFEFSKEQHAAVRYYPADEVDRLVQHPDLQAHLLWREVPGSRA